MKKPFLFKVLIDILIFLYFIGLIGLVIAIPLKKCIISPVKICIVDWTLFYWFIAIISIIAYVIFLKGLYHLRKVARFLTSKKYFSKIIITNLKKSGNLFLLTGTLYFSIIIALWINRLIEEKIFEIGYDMDLIGPLFLIIIGIFFIIQSKTLLLAKNFKEENELTI